MRFIRMLALGVLTVATMAAGPLGAAASATSTATDVPLSSGRIEALQLHRVNTTWLITIVTDGEIVDAESLQDLQILEQLDVLGMLEGLRAEALAELAGTTMPPDMRDAVDLGLGELGVDFGDDATYLDLIDAAMGLFDPDGGSDNPASGLANGWVIAGAILFFAILVLTPVIHDVLDGSDSGTDGGPDGGTGSDDQDGGEGDDDGDEGTGSDDEDDGGGDGEDDGGGDDGGEGGEDAGDTGSLDPDFGNPDPSAWRAYLLALNPALEGTEYDRVGQMLEFMTAYAAGQRPFHSNPVPIDDGTGGEVEVDFDGFGCIGPGCGVVDPTEDTSTFDVSPAMMEKVMAFGGPVSPAVSYPPLDGDEQVPGDDDPVPPVPDPGCEMCD